MSNKITFNKNKVILIAGFLLIALGLLIILYTKNRLLQISNQDEDQEKKPYLHTVAMNTNKPQYYPGEEVEISFGVLDSEGEMICDSDMRLRIVSPRGNITNLSTNEKTIVVNQNQCNTKEYMYQNDIEAIYEASEAGFYELQLVVKKGKETMEKKLTFEVTENIPFEIERFSPTRIYPVLEYPVGIRITANEDYKGKITEYVPENFILITEEERVLSTNIFEDSTENEQQIFLQNAIYGTGSRLNDDNNIVEWEVDLKTGDVVTLFYAYDSDDASPELYSLRGLEIGDFKEGRAWEVAVDNVFATIDSTVSATAANHQNDGRNLVYIDDETAYHFYVDSDGRAGYMKTINGGRNWASQVDLTAQTDCLGIVVWYDRWTPGYDGTIIHVAFLEAGNDIYYGNIDIANNDTQKGEVLAVDRSTTGHTASTDDYSITVGTNGTIYIAHQSSIATSTSGLRLSTDTGTNWSDASEEGLDDATADFVMITPLADADVMLLRWDVSTNYIQSKVYDSSANTWSASWTNIDTNAVGDPNASATDPHRKTWGALTHNSSFDVYLAYVDNAGLAASTPDVRTAIYSGSWTNKTDVISNTNSIMDTAIALDRNTGAIYVAYLRGTVNANSNAYYKVSTDGMNTWSVERGKLTTSEDDHKAIYMNLLSSEKLGVVIHDDDDDDNFYGNVADLGSVSSSIIITNLIGFEEGSTLDSNATNGTHSIQSSIVRSGDYALRSNPSSGTGYVEYPIYFATNGLKSSTDIDNIMSVFSLRIATAPSVDAIIWSPDETSARLQITLRTDRTISLNTNTGDGTGDFALDLNTWYTIALVMDSDTDTVEVAIYDEDMRNSLDYMYGTITSLEDADGIRYGIQTTSTADIYIDDIFIFSHAAISNFPLFEGNGHIVRLDPDGVGTDTAWAGNYTAIDEIPPDSSDYISITSTGDETSNLEDTSSAGIVGSIASVKITNTIWEATSQTATAIRAIRTRSPGAQESAVVDVNTTVGTAYSRMMDVNLGNANINWTTTQLDSLEAGVGNDTAATYEYQNGTLIVTVSYIDTITVSGNVYNHGTSDPLTECDANPYTNELKMYAYGDIYATSCSSSDGSFTFSNIEQPVDGRSIIIWINGNLVTNTNGVLVIRYDGSGDSTGHVFYDNAVTVRNDTVAGVSIENMAYYDYNDDPDIPFIATNASPDTLVVSDEYEFIVPSGKTFTPNGTTTFDDINIAGTYTADTGESITVSGNFTNSGTFTSSTSTVTLDGTTSENLNSGCANEATCTNQDFYNLIINKTDVDANDNITLLNNLKVTNLLTITDGELIQGAYNVRAEGTPAVSITSSGKWTNISTGGLTLGGEFANAGTATFQGSGETCGDTDTITIASTASSQRSWTGLGIFLINDVNVSWQGGTSSITAYSSTDGGNNSANWTILPTCSPPNDDTMMNFGSVTLEGISIY